MAMATLPHSVPGLEVTAPDDDMEISSDFEGKADDIIDIDLEDGGASPRDQEGDYMLDDASSVGGNELQRGGNEGNNDDIMLDDGNADLLDDGEMQEDPPNADEQLADASFEAVGSLDNTLGMAVGGDIPVLDQEVNVINFSDPSKMSSSVPLDAGQPEAHHQFQSEQPAEAEHSMGSNSLRVTDMPPATENFGLGQQPRVTSGHTEEHQVADGTITLALDTEDAASADPGAQGQLAASGYRVHGLKPVDQAEQEVATESIVEPLASGTVYQEPDHRGEYTLLDEDSAEAQDGDGVPAQHHDDERANDSDPLLHPVVVVYQGDEILLFPSNLGESSETYFLEDHSLVNQSIGKLLHACRNVLGDTMTEEEELELGIAELGLQINEDSIHATSTTFSEILDIYVQLRQSDDTPDIAPLYVTLTAKARFSSRLTSLLQAAQEGKNLSELTFLDQDNDSTSDFDGENNAQAADSEQPGRESSAYNTESAGEAETTVLDDGAQEGQATYEAELSQQNGLAAEDDDDEPEESHDHENHEQDRQEVTQAAEGEGYDEHGLQDDHVRHNSETVAEQPAKGETTEEEDDLVVYDQEWEEHSNTATPTSSTVRGDDTPTDNTGRTSDMTARNTSARQGKGNINARDGTKPTTSGTDAADIHGEQEQPHVEEVNVDRRNSLQEIKTTSRTDHVEENSGEYDNIEEYADNDNVEHLLNVGVVGNDKDFDKHDLVAQGSTSTNTQAATSHDYTDFLIDYDEDNLDVSDNVVPAHTDAGEPYEIYADQPTLDERNELVLEESGIAPGNGVLESDEVLELQESNSQQGHEYDSDSIDYEEDEGIAPPDEAKPTEHSATYQTPPGKRVRETGDDGTAEKSSSPKRARSG